MQLPFERAALTLPSSCMTRTRATTERRCLHCMPSFINIVPALPRPAMPSTGTPHVTPKIRAVAPTPSGGVHLFSLVARALQAREAFLDRQRQEHVVRDARDLLGILPRCLEHVQLTLECTTFGVLV